MLKLTVTPLGNSGITLKVDGGFGAKSIWYDRLKV